MIKNDLTLSVIIPARDEFPNIVHTVHSIVNCLEADGFTYNDFEIIIVDNCSSDNDFYPQRAVKGTTAHLMPRGIYWSRILRVLYDPIAGNHSARNKGAKIARGKYLFFSDGHMSYKPGFFKNILKTTEETKGLVHGVIAWMGGYPPTQSGLGYQYTIKLGEEAKGTWANYAVSEDTPFYIAAQGHCCLAVDRKQFLSFGGYPKIHRTYGGGELYIDMKWWMFGSSVVVDPNAIGYHLSSSRGYTYHHDDYKENVLGVLYSLGADDWRERSYLNWLRNGRKDVLDRIMQRNENEYAEDRKFIEEKRKYTFNQIMVEKPWDKLNQETFGKSNSGFMVFHDTWLPLLENTPAKEAYENSKYQKDLEKFIDENLSQYVYKRKVNNFS